VSYGYNVNHVARASSDDGDFHKKNIKWETFELSTFYSSRQRDCNWDERVAGEEKLFFIIFCVRLELFWVAGE
jgi:hypothetical protein